MTNGHQQPTAPGGSNPGPNRPREPARRVTLVLVLHSHQPVGNLDFAVRYATDHAYRPLLEVLAEYPELVCSLHYSGSLLEWFQDHAPDLMERIGELVARGQVELIGGAFYDPILTMLPEEDRRGQITTFADYLERTFGRRPRGAWVAERVWEQTLTRSLADAAVEYITLDDSHFLAAGLTEAQLTGAFLTEEDGRLLRVYPASEELRYLIPFREPQESLQYLARRLEAADGPVVVYADDGEKFGSWPGTHEHVYGKGWLRRFIELLLESCDWLHLSTLAEVTDGRPPVGKVYLPDASYREMTEWALPTERLLQYQDLVSRLKAEGRYQELKPFLRMGYWRNFKVKYREANLLYAKSLRVSRKVNALLARPPRPPAGRRLLERARRELYRGQCNCPYWHGVFGGLYLPHLRSAAYRHLIAAEAVADRLTHGGRSWVEVEEVDFDLDGRAELLLSNPQLVAGLIPQRGGHLFELDLRAGADPEDLPRIAFHLTNSLTRRPEAYHRNLASEPEPHQGDAVKTIHHIVALKEPDLGRRLHYDPYERESLVEHCLAPEVTVEELEALRYRELGDFVEGEYEVVGLERGREEVRVRLARLGQVQTADGVEPFLVEKTVVLPRQGTHLTVAYRLTNRSERRLRFRFAVEWEFSLLAGDAPDRYYFLPPEAAGGREVNLGPLRSRHSLPAHPQLGLRDESTGMELLLTAEPPAGWFLHPLESVSQSEAGLESVYQSSCVMPHWLIDLEPGAVRELGLTLTIALLKQAGE